MKLNTVNDRTIGRVSFLGKIKIETISDSIFE